ncbi:MAG: hypothetical protein IIZ30_14895 [Sphingomonas sp.]|uniref:hypothetical protein n=1 Tax=Sphingomonas sp. TaxID=28214 RepID=UPI00258014AA|nr:hypothetical protein [Sphingomonas sp.]MBQ1481309.1 hypothetical protein [Sphingomonas sp.]
MADIPESTKMLPCPNPWCENIRGVEAARHITTAKWHICCGDCLIDGPWADTCDLAIAAWNTRAAPPAMDREAAYRQALEDVCNPLGYLQRMADAEGAKLSGMAYAIASDIGTIQRIAKEALSTLSADAIRQGEGWQPISDADTSQERLTVLGYGTFRGRSHPQVVVLDWVKWIGSWSAYTMPFEPTHWMPLPDAPASHASDGGK